MNLHAALAAHCVTHADERLSRYTTFQLGGPCPLMIFCQTPEQLAVTVAELHSVHQKFFVMGGGSNLLVADAGVPVVVVRYLGDQPDIRHTAGVVEVSGATLLDDAVAFTVAQGLAGFTFASGIPGTIGGALAGNAGAFGQQIGDSVEAVTLLDRTGRTRTASRADMRFAYRSSGLSDSGEIVVAARLRLASTNAAELEQQRAENLFIRRQKHPDWRVLPTAGSFFKNVTPTSAAGRRQSAGWFLEQAGALQMRVRGARPFEKHANIIVRDGDCTAQDVLALAQQMADAVEQKFQLRLVREVQLLGQFQ